MALHEEKGTSLFPPAVISQSSLFYGVLFLLFASRAAMSENKLLSCLTEDKLIRRARKMLAHSGGAAAAERISAGASDAESCPEFSRRHFTADPRTRSLSPWRTIKIQNNEGMFPESYLVAECLCSGCIINGSESFDYNSVEVKRSLMFLIKVPCEMKSHNETKYSLQVEYKEVPVACTCVHPQQ